MDDTEQLQILLVDDHPIVRDGLRARLSTRTDWNVCGEAETPAEAIRLVREFKPRVVIIDLSLKTGSGLELIKQLAAFPSPPLMLVCSMHEESLYAQRAIQAGASGFIHKQHASEHLLAAIDRILSGKLFVSEEVSDRLLHRLMKANDSPSQNPIEDLTDRELQVFEAIGRGLTVAQIAEELFLSAKTVETYRDRTKRKLNLKTSAELMRYAVRWATEQSGS